MRRVLGAALLGVTFAATGHAAEDEVGRYQIAATTDDWKRAWRIDTKTGEVSLCSVAPDFTGCRKLAEGEPLPPRWGASPEAKSRR